MLGAQRQAGGVWLPHGMGSGVALGNPRFHFPLAILQKALFSPPVRTPLTVLGTLP